jgi:uncharacterized protein involved in tellurium resistance
MIITDPRFAPRRDDLPFLRRRVRSESKVAGAAAPAISFARPERAISFARPQRAHSSPPPPSPPSPPSPPPPAPAATPAPPAASSSLDLDAPAPAAVPAPPAASASLDLDAPAPAATPAPPVTAPAVPPRRLPADPRVHAAERAILTVSQPTITLTRLQSAIGTLTIEAACSAEVGDLRLGAAYQLRSGPSSVMQRTQGNRFAPPGSRRPILVGTREPFERVSIDLRQSADLERLIIYGFSEGRTTLRWGGTLIITTFGGAKVELPLETLAGGDVAVLVSLYNIAGEFVLRAEMQTLYGGVREAARAYGYHRITWLDDRTPVD